MKEVIDLLEWGSEKNAVAVILHSFKVMDETILSNAVVS